MSVKWESVQPGDVLWEKRRVDMGNTTSKCDAVYGVRIVSIDHVNGTAMASWNSNLARRYTRHGIEKLSRKKPTPRPNIFERARAAMKDKS